MKNVKNAQLRKKLDKLGIKDVVLNFSEGTCMVWSEDEFTDDVLFRAEPYIYLNSFNNQTLDMWINDIKELYDKGLEKLENEVQLNRNENGIIKLDLRRK